MSRWPAILERAAAIVASYDTGVTLRQLFYRLVAASRARQADRIARMEALIAELATLGRRS